MSERHPAHRPGEGMVWIACAGKSLLEGIEIAARKFDRWGIAGGPPHERVLLCSLESLERLCTDLQHRRPIVGMFRRSTTVDVRDYLAEHCGVTRVVVSELFTQPLLRHDAGHPRPAGEATIMEPTS